MMKDKPRRGRPPKANAKQRFTTRLAPEVLEDLEDFVAKVSGQYPEVSRTKVLELAFAFCSKLEKNGKLDLDEFLGTP